MPFCFWLAYQREKGSSRADYSAVIGMMAVVTWANPRVKDTPRAGY